MKNKAILFSRSLEKALERLPQEIQTAFWEKLELLTQNPAHPSLRFKKIKGTSSIWELSVTMNYRVTLEVHPDEIFFRRIGTHDILRHP